MAHLVLSICAWTASSLWKKFPPLFSLIKNVLTSYFTVFFAKKKMPTLCFFFLSFSSFLMMRSPTDISGCLRCSQVTEVGGFYLPAMCALARALCCKRAGPRNFTCCTPTYKENILFGRRKFADTSVNMHLFRKTKAIPVSLTRERSTSPLSASSFNRQSDPRATVLFLLVWQRRSTALSLACHCRANLFHLR